VASRGVGHGVLSLDGADLHDEV
jgi:hypothetical protein